LSGVKRVMLDLSGAMVRDLEVAQEEMESRWGWRALMESGMEGEEW